MKNTPRLRRLPDSVLSWSVGRFADVLVYGDSEVEACAFSQLGFSPDLPAVRSNNLLTDGQADAGTRVFIAWMQSLKDFKDPLGITGFETDSIVLDGEQPDVIAAL